MKSLISIGFITLILACSANKYPTSKNVLPTDVEMSIANVDQNLRIAQIENDKTTARDIYRMIEEVEAIGNGTDLLSKYKMKAAAIGKNNVLLRFHASVFDHLSDIEINQVIEQLPANDNQWTLYHINLDIGTPIDHVVEVHIDKINVGIDQLRTSNRIRTFRKRYARRPSQVDSTRTPQPSYRTVTLNDETTSAQKMIYLKGKINLIDNRSQKIIQTKNLDMSSLIRYEQPSFAERVINGNASIPDLTSFSKRVNNSSTSTYGDDHLLSDILLDLANQLGNFLNKTTL